MRQQLFDHFQTFYNQGKSTLKPRRFLIGLVLLWLPVFLTSCVKAQIVIDVQENGSVDMATALGLTTQAKALMGSQGYNPNTLLDEAFSGVDSTVTTRQWTEGEYEWVEGKITLPSLEELNHRMTETNELVQSFTLVKERGLLKDRFVLDAVLEPFNQDLETSSDYSFDPSGMLEFRVLVRLPGTLIETNGVYDQNQDAMAWVVNSTSPVSLHAVSELWNWVNIGIMGGGIGLVLLLIVIGTVLLTTNRKKSIRKKAALQNQRSAIQRTKKPSKEVIATPVSMPDHNDEPIAIPESNLLSQLKIRKLLEQANLHVLKNTGVIFESPTELRLAWPDPDHTGSQYEILVQTAGETKITVNGTACDANLQDVQTALLANLRLLKAM